ncbi:MAG: MaoC/PaaZ C-terminal domain-containing protein [Myxococcota bacterium]
MPDEQVYWDDVSEGQEISLQEPMSSQRLVIWAAASGDFYQIHYDDGFAKSNDLPDIIVHGALKGMMVGRLLDEWTGDDGRIVSWNVSYRGMDPARQDLRIWGKVTKKYDEGGEGRVDLNVGVTQPDGTETTPGSATVALPKRA